jgi:hypothetical protein
MSNLSLESERSTDLVASLIELLGVQRSSNAEGEALVDLGVVCKGKDAAVVDLGLIVLLATIPIHLTVSTNLCESSRVNLVLAGNFQANSG